MGGDRTFRQGRRTESMGKVYHRMWNTVLSGIDKSLGRSRVAARPLRIHIEVNDYCNLKCPYCPRENPLIPKDTGNIPLDRVKKLEPWIRKANYVGLAGNGEPFMHPKIMDILRIVTGAGAVPSVITNGTRFKPAYIEELPTLGPMLLMISVDGGTKETFEKWRRGADFDKVREALRALKASREQHNSPYPIVNFIVCLMKENIGETEQIVDLAAEVGAAVIVFQPMFPYVKDLEYLRVLDLKTIEEAVERARRRAAPHGIRIDFTPMSFDIDYREGTSQDPTVGSVDRLEKGYFTEEMKKVEMHEAWEDNQASAERKGGTAVAKRAMAAASAAGSESVVVTGVCTVPGGPENVSHEPEIGSPETDESPSAPAHSTPQSADGSHAGPTVYHCENIWHQLHVTLNGDVKPCCFWTEGIVGNIDHDPLERMWNGPEMNRVRATIHRGKKFPPCRGCHWLVRQDKKKIWRDTLKELRDLWRSRR